MKIIKLKGVIVVEQLENKWKEYKKMIDTAVLEKNDIYYDLIRKGVLIPYEKKDSNIEIICKTELSTIFEE